MKISKKDLRTDLPPIIYTGEYVNCVLAVHADSLYCKSNTYIPKWTICNTVYYNKFPEQYEGWIELEELLPPEFTEDIK